MTTHLSLDPALVAGAFQVSGARTEDEAVTLALEEFIARQAQKTLIGLMGKLEWDPSFEHKAERSRR